MKKTGDGRQGDRLLRTNLRKYHCALPLAVAAALRNEHLLTMTSAFQPAFVDRNTLRGIILSAGITGYGSHPMN